MVSRSKGTAGYRAGTSDRDSEFPDWNSRRRSQFQNAVLEWFSQNARDLPWRHEITPYRTWISEIMLQQTQVVTVIDYWKRFLKRFPDVAALAEAPQQEVLKYWEGLGYYRRARQLHSAAQQIVQNHAGQFPTRYEDVLALPGIGRYTAGAILSIATQQALPILEGNTIRLFARLLAIPTDPTRSDNQRVLWNFAQHIVPDQQPGLFNQGLMEIGNLVCRPAQPDCPHCPLRKHCQTFQQGLQDKIPAPKEKKVQYQDCHHCLIVIPRRSRFLARLCPPGQHWAGLWDLFRLDLTDLVKETGAGANKKELHRVWMENEILQQTGLQVQLKFLDWERRHAVTRYRIQLTSAQAIQVQGKLQKHSPWQWLEADQLRQQAFNITARQFIADQLKLTASED